MYPDRRIHISIVLSLFAGLILLAALAFEIRARQAASPESSPVSTPDASGVQIALESKKRKKPQVTAAF